MSTHSVYEAREALGRQLREIRRKAGLTGRQLASLTGWPGSKISKIEYGKQPPSDEDIRQWCLYCAANGEVDDLLASLRNLEAMYVEWRRMLGSGTRRRQEKSIRLERETKLFRWYEPVIVPGLLQTQDYAAQIMRRVVDFYETADDVEVGVMVRMERQQILFRGDHRFHFILAEQVLRTRVADASVLAVQLDRLKTILRMPRVSLGIVPFRSTYEVPTNQFIIFDQRLVNVETVSAELSIAQPREIALYEKVFSGVSAQAVYGVSARQLIDKALLELAGSAD